MQFNEIYTNDLDEGFKDPGIFKAIFMAGPPGAGKNIVLKSLGLKSAGLKLQDIDHTLAYLQRAKANIRHDGDGYEQSLQVTRRKQTVLQQEMLGLIINTTGRDYESLINLKKELESVGYQTFMLFVDVEEDIAWNRAQQRFANATDPKDKNRPVDKEYFDLAYQASKKNADFYALLFEDRFALVDNNIDQTQRQITARMVDRKSEERITVLMREAARKITRFLAAPLTPSAQAAVNAAKQKRGLE
jgi:shikimate kinase